MVLGIVCCSIVLAGVSPAAAQNPGTTTPQAPDNNKDAQAQAHAEIARLVHDLDVLLEKAQAAQASVTAALAQAQRTEAQTPAAEQDRAAKITAELRLTLDTLSSAITSHVKKIRELRDKAAAGIPSEQLDPQASFRPRILATTKLPSLSAEEEALLAIETELQTDKWRRCPGTAEVLAFARYRLADTLRQRASAEIEKNNSREGERLLLRATKRLADVLNAPDAANTGEGSSLHAAALRRIVEIETVLYDGYRRLAVQQPEARSHAENARAHREAGVQAFDKLKRVYPDATLPDGSRAVDAARADANRLLQMPPP
jgi:hypothetical protein